LEVCVKLMPRGQFDRSARRAETRARLLQAAAEAYALHGFGGATLDEVAAQAGMTKGAVYDHFGSKENLLLALMEEYLAGQVAAQLVLFDRERTTSERPLAGSEDWMARLHESPDRFRLFVELWTHAQRDERLRRHLAGALRTLHATFTGFAAASAADADADVPTPVGAPEQFANVALGLGIGLAMLKLTDSDTIPDSLLGVVLSMLIRALESDPEARALLAGPKQAPAKKAGKRAPRRPSHGEGTSK
jgi:AcrR family transcriptional regulator